MRRLSVALMLSVALCGPAIAQDRTETLADIRQQLSTLYVEMQRLKRELSTTGGPANIATTGTVLERVDAIEAELSRLTAKTEQLEFRVDSVVRDGTNRIGDLEYRLVELEGGDVTQLGETTTLGGDAAAPSLPAPVTPPDSGAAGGAELALGEQADFDAAKAALDAGNNQEAATLFQSFIDTYPGGGLSSEAHYLRGNALAATGDTSAAARAYLNSFSGSPAGSHAPDALYRLGASLGELGQTREACVTLAEVSARFPGSAAATEAQTARGRLACE